MIDFGYILKLCLDLLKYLGNMAELVLDFFNTPVDIWFLEFLSPTITQVFPFLELNDSGTIPLYSLIIGGGVILALVINFIRWVFSLIDWINPS